MGFSKLTNSENINGRDVIGIDNLVKDTEAVKRGEKKRVFEYKLDDKAAKAKMVKGAKRIPFEVAANSSSLNLNFSLGAWSNVVLPSIRYLTQAKGSMWYPLLILSIFTDSRRVEQQKIKFWIVG